MGEIVVKDPCLSIIEGNFYVGHPAHHAGVSLLYDNTRPPLGIPDMDYLVTRLEVEPPRFFFHSNTPPEKQPSSVTEREPVDVTL